MEDNVIEAKFKDGKLIFGIHDLEKLDENQLTLLRKGLLLAVSNIDELNGSGNELEVVSIKLNAKGLAVTLNKNVIETLPMPLLDPLMDAFQKTMTEILDIKGISHDINIQRVDVPISSTPKNEVN